MHAQYEITVYGRVQGVGYRYFACKRAAEHRVSGYVRNIPGSVVHIVAEGEITDLDTFVDHLRMGPVQGRVTRIAVSKSAFTGEYSDFTIRY